MSNPKRQPKISNRGGAREGAGRPPSENPMQRVTVHLTPQQIETLEEVDSNLARAIRSVLDKALPKKVGKGA
jgi:hypothetical protein